ncbi:MAG: H/ACA ribonucleoprotein complex subunit GAR1/NAF1 [Candidatus Hodarchaeales archaeon]|jgi:rRNA processing protein Gar1
MKKRIDRPLGKILHIVEGDAITRPHTPFRAPNSKVVLEDLEEIGILKEPFGPTSKPYQPIKLSNPNKTDIIGKLAFAQVMKSKNRRRRSKKDKKSH